MKKAIYSFLMIVLVSITSQANIAYSMPALEVGFKLNTIDITGATSNKQTQAFQAGGTIVFDLMGENSPIGVRTGLMYSERAFENTVGTATVKGNISYIDIPLQVMFKFENYAGLYVGPSFSTKLGDTCDNCTLSDIKGSIMPITFGGQFKFAPNFGLNIFFETASGELATDLKNSRAFGANFLFTFE